MPSRRTALQYHTRLPAPPEAIAQKWLRSTLLSPTLRSTDARVRPSDIRALGLAHGVLAEGHAGRPNPFSKGTVLTEHELRKRLVESGALKP